MKYCLIVLPLLFVWSPVAAENSSARAIRCAKLCYRLQGVVPQRLEPWHTSGCTQT